MNHVAYYSYYTFCLAEKHKIIEDMFYVYLWNILYILMCSHISLSKVLIIAALQFFIEICTVKNEMANIFARLGSQIEREREFRCALWSKVH